MAPINLKVTKQLERERGGGRRQTDRQTDRGTLLTAIFTGVEIRVWDKLLSGQPLIEDDWTASKV